MNRFVCVFSPLRLCSPLTHLISHTQNKVYLLRFIFQVKPKLQIIIACFREVKHATIHFWAIPGVFVLRGWICQPVVHNMYGDRLSSLEGCSEYVRWKLPELCILLRWARLRLHPLCERHADVFRWRRSWILVGISYPKGDVSINVNCF